MAENRIDPDRELEDNRQNTAGLPGGGAGRTDITGIVPEGVHPDPDITEGHPGYQESGSSEIRPEPAAPKKGS